MQKVDGDVTNGFCCMEWQDWLEAVVLPAAHDFAEREFLDKGPYHWFKQKTYTALCVATDHDPTSHVRKFLLSHDADRRHSYKATVLHNGVSVHMDRRLLPPSHKQHIALHPDRDYVPLCAKVPDCIQSPIEMFFAPVKAEYKRLIMQRRKAGFDTTPEVVVKTALQAFQTKGSQDSVGKCWRHAAKSILVWMLQCDQHVTIDGKQYQGAGGNWVPKELAG